MKLVGYRRYSISKFREMYTRYAREIKGICPGLADSDFEEEKLDALRTPKSIKLYIAEQGIGPVGLTVLQPSTSALTLVDLYVLPEYRGRGYGTEALRLIADEFPEADMMLQCRKDNNSGCSFFREAVNRCGLDVSVEPQTEDAGSESITICFRTEPKTAMTDKLALSVEETAAKLGISRTTLYRNLLNRDDFPKIKVGRRILIPKEELDAWLKSSSNVSSPAREDDYV